MREQLLKRQTGSSRYAAISRRKDTGKWRVQFGTGLYRVYLGQFDTEAEAAEALSKYLEKQK